MESPIEAGMAAVMAAYQAHVERQDREAPDWEPIPAAECKCPPRAETPAQQAAGVRVGIASHR